MDTNFCIRCGDELETDVVSLCEDCLKQLHIKDHGSESEKGAGDIVQRSDASREHATDAGHRPENA